VRLGRAAVALQRPEQRIGVAAVVRAGEETARSGRAVAVAESLARLKPSDVTVPPSLLRVSPPPRSNTSLPSTVVALPPLVATV
jgi:hypothetical protein